MGKGRSGLQCNRIEYRSQSVKDIILKDMQLSLWLFASNYNLCRAYKRLQTWRLAKYAFLRVPIWLFS